MAPSSSSLSSNEELLTKVSHIQSLLPHFTATLTAPAPSISSPLPASDAPNPLHVLRDAARLLHAHATKIGLLLINDPFTPSAVLKELTACESQCLLGMMGAVEVCHPKSWTPTLVKEVRLRVEAVMSGFGALLVDVKTKAEGGTITARQKEKTLASTGQVWGACDVLIALEKMGLAGFVVKKAQEFRDMVKDALEEIKEWGEDEEDQDEGFVGSDNEGDNDSIEDMFSAANRLPSHRKDLKVLLNDALKRLKLVDMLYQALLKRRLKTFTPQESSSEVEAQARLGRLDDLSARLKAISESVDELAEAFYELDVETAKIRLGQIVEDAKSTGTAMDKSWAGEEDEFTTWAVKWREAIDRQYGKTAASRA